MKDVSRKELQAVVEGICKYCSNNRNHLAQDLYRQMNRDDYLGRFGHICCNRDMQKILAMFLYKLGSTKRISIVVKVFLHTVSKIRQFHATIKRVHGKQILQESLFCQP